MLTLATQWLKKGHKVTIFCLKDVTQYTLNANISVVFPLSSYKGSLRGWFNTRVLADLLQSAFDSQAQTSGPFDFTLLNLHESYRLGSALNLPNCYFVIHNSYVQELKRERLMGPLKYWYMKRIVKGLNNKRLIGVSKGVSEELKSADLFSAKSVTHIYNPFNINEILALAHMPVDIPLGQKYILHVGRAAKAKRHDVLFQAFKSVDAKYKLVCLSSNVKKLEKLALKYSISDRVILPGFTENPYAWMKSASVLVLSSDFEGLSMVLVEALICDTPIVSTNCPHGPSEIMTNNLQQFLVELGNVEQLSDAMNKAVNYELSGPDKAFINSVDASNIANKYLDLC